VRRIGFIVASAAALSVIAPPPAAAHVCVTPVEIGVREPAAITVGVPAEVQAVVAVAIEVPEGFDLDEARDAPGWTVDRDGTTVRYTGGEIPRLQCGYFTLTGSATRRAKLVFPVTATDATGAVTEYGRGRLGAQEVYAGIEALPDEDGSGPDVTLIAGIVLVAAGAVAAAVLVVRRRQARG
jgi:hypothetical protein